MEPRSLFVGPGRVEVVAEDEEEEIDARVDFEEEPLRKP